MSKITSRAPSTRQPQEAQESQAPAQAEDSGRGPAAPSVSNQDTFQAGGTRQANPRQQRRGPTMNTRESLSQYQAFGGLGSPVQQQTRDSDTVGQGRDASTRSDVATGTRTDAPTEQQGARPAQGSMPAEGTTGAAQAGAPMDPETARRSEDYALRLRYAADPQTVEGVSQELQALASEGDQAALGALRDVVSDPYDDSAPLASNILAQVPPAHLTPEDYGRMADVVGVDRWSTQATQDALHQAIEEGRPGVLDAVTSPLHICCTANKVFLSLAEISV